MLNLLVVCQEKIILRQSRMGEKVRKNAREWGAKNKNLSYS